MYITKTRKLRFLECCVAFYSPPQWIVAKHMLNLPGLYSYFCAFICNGIFFLDHLAIASLPFSSGVGSSEESLLPHPHPGYLSHLGQSWRSLVYFHSLLSITILKTWFCNWLIWYLHPDQLKMSENHLVKVSFIKFWSRERAKSKYHNTLGFWDIRAVPIAMLISFIFSSLAFIWWKCSQLPSGLNIHQSLINENAAISDFLPKVND